ncbi:MAG TPA: hypothetical protein VKU41_02920 [Polyangiaceae bacterium]|nr:hypothetical protein [Polyangiaceae bacterium]
MKPRFVSAVLAAVALATGLVTSRAAEAQEIQLTGPLKGAPAVRQERLYRKGRFEIAPAASFSLLDEYRRTILAGGRLTYNILDWLGIGVWGGFGAASITTDLTDRIDQAGGAPRDPLTAVNVNHLNNPSGGFAPFAAQAAKLTYVAAPQLTFVPFRGKLAIFNKIFVDTDFYASGGVAFVGVDERGNCGAPDQLKCSNPNSFKLTSTSKVTWTAGFGLTFYPANFFSLGVEYRLLPFAWNRAGFDSKGSGTNGNFPDGRIDGQDEEYVFNQLVTVSLGFYLPTKPKLSE